MWEVFINLGFHWVDLSAKQSMNILSRLTTAKSSVELSRKLRVLNEISDNFWQHKDLAVSTANSFRLRFNSKVWFTSIWRFHNAKEVFISRWLHEFWLILPRTNNSINQLNGSNIFNVLFLFAADSCADQVDNLGLIYDSTQNRNGLRQKRSNAHVADFNLLKWR